MDVEFDFPNRAQDPIVYVRPVDPADLPENLRAQVSPDSPVYAICDADGAQLALAKDRSIAFALARTNAMQPVSVH